MYLRICVNLSTCLIDQWTYKILTWGTISAIHLCFRNTEAKPQVAHSFPPAAGAKWKGAKERVAALGEPPDFDPPAARLSPPPPKPLSPPPPPRPRLQPDPVKECELELDKLDPVASLVLVWNNVAKVKIFYQTKFKIQDNLVLASLQSFRLVDWIQSFSKLESLPRSKDRDPRRLPDTNQDETAGISIGCPVRTCRQTEVAQAPDSGLLKIV